MKKELRKTTIKDLVGRHPDNQSLCDPLYHIFLRNEIEELKSRVSRLESIFTDKNL